MNTTFYWIDYFLFGFMLVLSAVIGVYYGVFKEQKTATDYLMGGKQMNVWPIAMSLISSQLSGLALISFPADTYRYGITFWFSVPMMTFVGLASYFIFLPVFYKLDVTSIYEYLAVRFSNKVRIYASVLFSIHIFLFLPITIYVPALALAQVTGISVHFITPVVCSICIFYTTLGGMKAMVKTDAIQFGIMLGTICVVVAVGTYDAGGFRGVFEKAYEGGRLDVSFQIDLLKRDTFWAASIGFFFMLCNHFCISQSFVQKCLSLPSYEAIKSVLILETVGIILIKSLCIFTGLIIFAKYSDCDPLESKIVKNYDQLLPMYVMDLVGFIPGFPGLFLAGIFSAALSTLSASLNCLSATIYKDFISPFVPKDTTQERVSLYLKLLVVIIGIFSTICVLIVEKMGSLLALTISFGSMTGGALLGLFVAGMLVPPIKAKGALCGGVAALGVCGWIIVGGLVHKIQGTITYPILPVSTHGCNATLLNTVNETLATTVQVIVDDSDLEPFVLYRVSFFWYVSIGTIVTLVVGIVVSYFTDDDTSRNKDHFSPLIHFLLKDEDFDKPPKYDTIERAKN